MADDAEAELVEQARRLKQDGAALWPQVFDGASLKAATKACKTLRELLERALDTDFLDLVSLVLDCGSRGEAMLCSCWSWHANHQAR